MLLSYFVDISFWNKKISAVPDLLYTNARSLNVTKRDELQAYLTIHNVGIVCVSETWINVTKQPHSHIPGYDGHFSNRSDCIGGSVVICVNSSFQTETLSAYTSSTFSSIWVRVSVHLTWISSMLASTILPIAMKKTQLNISQPLLSN